MKKRDIVNALYPIWKVIGYDVCPNTNIKCPDPNHNDRTPSATIYNNKENIIYCHACKKKMDVLYLAKVNSLSIDKMYNDVLQIYGSLTEIKKAMNGKSVNRKEVEDGFPKLSKSDKDFSSYTKNVFGIK